jgi:hypothetical protein
VKDQAVALMVSDVVQELIEKTRSARDEASRSNSGYDSGRHFAFYEVLSLLAQQAQAFGVDRSAIGLDKLDLENDLLGP